MKFIGIINLQNIVETVLRFTMQYCYIIEGRDIVRMIRKSCQRCRFLRKRTIDVEMRPVSNHRLTTAPAFYATQVDISRPSNAYSPHKKKYSENMVCCLLLFSNSHNQYLSNGRLRYIQLHSIVHTFIL